ncbi:phage tail protein [Mucilaginibacter sp. AW1-3]
MQQYLGEIRVFGFTTVPRGWAACNGQLLAIAQNQALFSLLGTFYGGNGVSTFQLPNLQSSTMVGAGTAPSGTTYVLGEIGGVENVTLLTPQLPAHNHMVAAQTAVATVSLNAAQPYELIAQPASDTNTVLSYSNSVANGTPLISSTLSPLGGNLPHSNMPPYLTLNVCIALQGIFPSRN